MLASDLAKDSEFISPHRPYPNQPDIPNHHVNHSEAPPPPPSRVSPQAVNHSDAPPPTAFQGTAQAVDKSNAPPSADKLPAPAVKRGEVATVAEDCAAAAIAAPSKVVKAPNTRQAKPVQPVFIFSGFPKPVSACCTVAQNGKINFIMIMIGLKSFST